MNAGARDSDGAIVLRGLSRLFADGTGLHPIDLDVAPGEFVSVLGPSGCGKSTLLRCIAGLETPSTGSVRFGDTVVFDAAAGIDVPPRRRGLGMVFQDLALWPHLSAFENVAFPLRIARLPRARVSAEVEHALELVGLAGFATKMPHQLSGGQQQRVAIARAIVAQPRILLMDEPFSALDAALRVQLRAELRELTTRLGLTTVYVTHDQVEAMSMSDRILVLDRGHLRQADAPETLYLRPADDFVAGFVGRFNRLPGMAAGSGARPEHVRVLDGDGLAEVVVEAVVVSCAYHGGVYQLRCRVEGQHWVVDHHSRLAPGERLRLGIAEADLIAVATPATTGAA